MPDFSADDAAFVAQFRAAAPYVHAHRGRTFVIVFGGEAADSPGFGDLVQDVALLHALGVRVVLVHGARPQIERRMREAGLRGRIHRDQRVTDATALPCVKQAVGALRLEIEAMLSMGLASTSMAGARLRVASGNFVTAQPRGVIDGVDMQFTGDVRRVDAEGVRRRLDDGAIVLCSPVAPSVTGELFNVGRHAVAEQVAVAIGADKLIALVEGAVPGPRAWLGGELAPAQARQIAEGSWPEDLPRSRLSARRRLPPDVRRHLAVAARACEAGVGRVHLVERTTHGGLLLELFTRDGIGTLVSREAFERLRPATLADVPGILALTAPLEAQGVLIRRTREDLEHNVDDFVVIERDGLVVACGALHALPDAAAGEIAAVCVHPEYRGARRGERLMGWLERRALERGLTKLFVLTTRTSHFFRRLGYEPAHVRDLPPSRRSRYDRRRNSRVLAKTLSPSP
ncbi:MAG: amino-acid N-acetyltransferase [Myxococcota bacterium]|nr:amino-acid N-acetyltransferase [Myxococcota bacterium]MDW8362184.1 amino-acid N-acetyltransferase [Myxococcales bacterium]